MGKGSRNERAAVELLQSAGYATYRPATVRFGENDPFGLFDVLAFHVDKPPLFVQVKSNRAGGVQAWMRQTWLWASHGLLCQYWVKHDREGWRILEPDTDGYRTVVDERKRDGTIGQYVADYLEHAVGE